MEILCRSLRVVHRGGRFCIAQDLVGPNKYAIVPLGAEVHVDPFFLLLRLFLLFLGLLPLHLFLGDVH